MADEKSFSVLAQSLSQLCPKLAPQVVPSGDINAKQILESIKQKVTSRTPSKTSFCELCGRAVTAANVQDEEENVTASRVLRWEVDLVKKCLTIVEVQVACQDCQILLNMQELLTFFATPKEESDQAKVYQLACHFVQVNGHDSKSGEGDVTLLQQVVAAVHSLHVLSKNISDITVRGQDGKIITLDSCLEVAKTLLETKHAAPHSAKKTKKKKHSAHLAVGDVPCENDGSSSREKLRKKTPKKMKKPIKSDTMENGLHPLENDDEEAVELETTQVIKTVSPKTAKKSRLALSEKKLKRLSPLVKQRKKKRRQSAPGMVSGETHHD